jgi:acetyl-CoA carboxylase alpha subunit
MSISGLWIFDRISAGFGALSFGASGAMRFAAPRMTAIHAKYSAILATGADRFGAGQAIASNIQDFGRLARRTIATADGREEF